MESNKTKIVVDSLSIDRTNISSGGCELIDSRSFILYSNDEPVEIEEVFIGSFILKIRIITCKDEKGERSIKINIDKEHNVIEYRCYNFDNVLGTGTKKAIEIGSINEKKIYIHFWIYSMGDKDNITRKLEYSLWREK